MLGQRNLLSPPALLCAFLLLFITAGRADAHKLSAEAHVLPGRMLQVESWFSDGTKPWRGKVQAFREDGELSVEGRLNEDGVFVFSTEKPERLRLVVSAGDGHTVELFVPEEALAAKVSGPVRLSQPDLSLPIKELLIGVAVVLALAAFVISLLRSRRLREVRTAKNQQAFKMGSSAETNITTKPETPPQAPPPIAPTPR